SISNYILSVLLISSHIRSSALYLLSCLFLFFFTDTATTDIYTLSLHDALPIYSFERDDRGGRRTGPRELCRPGDYHRRLRGGLRSEEHTSELQSRVDLVCRLLLEKKKRITRSTTIARTRALHILAIYYTVLATD